MEDIVWDAITEKAKEKFDFNAFSMAFIKIDESFADNILFQIIVGFASGETKEVIAMKLHSNMLMAGLVWNIKDIEEFVRDKEDILKLEIYVTQLAGDLFSQGNEPISVLNSVNQLLG